MKEEWLPRVRGRERWIDRAQRAFRAMEIFCMI